MTVYQQQVSFCRALRYIIISATAGALVAMTTIDAEPHGAANGLTTSILLLYTTYTLLAGRRLLIAVLTGGLLTLLQLGLFVGLNLQHLSVRRLVGHHHRQSSSLAKEQALTGINVVHCRNDTKLERRWGLPLTVTAVSYYEGTCIYMYAYR